MKAFGNYVITDKFLLVMTIIVMVVSMVVFIKNNTNEDSVQHIKQEMDELKETISSMKEQKNIQTTRDVETIMTYVRFLADSDLSDKYVRTISTAFHNASIYHDIDPKVLVAIAYQESRFIATRTSNKGAMGIMQVMPFWVKHKGLSSHIGLSSTADLYNPIMGIYAGAYIYAHYRDQWKEYGISDKALMKITLLSYNRGKTTVMKRIKRKIDPENGYNTDISGRIDRLVVLDETIS